MGESGGGGAGEHLTFYAELLWCTYIYVHMYVLKIRRRQYVCS